MYVYIYKQVEKKVCLPHPTNEKLLLLWSDKGSLPPSDVHLGLFFSRNKYSWNSPIIIDYEWICVLLTSVNAQTKWRLLNTAGQADLQHHCCCFAAAKVSPIWTPDTNIKGSRLHDDDNNHKNWDDNNNHDTLDWNQDSNVKTDRKHRSPSDC